MTARFLSSMLLGMACMASFGCDEKLSSVAGPTPTLEPTFASIQTDIFQTTDSSGRTPCVQCHTSSGKNPSGGLDLDPDVAYANLVNTAAREKAGAIRVIPGDPDN